MPAMWGGRHPRRPCDNKFSASMNASLPISKTSLTLRSVCLVTNNQARLNLRQMLCAPLSSNASPECTPAQHARTPAASSPPFPAAAAAAPPASCAAFHSDVVCRKPFPYPPTRIPARGRANVFPHRCRIPWARHRKQSASRLRRTVWGSNGQEGQRRADGERSGAVGHHRREATHVPHHVKSGR